MKRFVFFTGAAVLIAAGAIGAGWQLTNPTTREGVMVAQVGGSLAGEQLAQAPQGQMTAEQRRALAHQVPGLSFSEPRKDFPTIEEGEHVTVRFDFVNTSEETIRITNIRASCGCTVPTLAKRTYAPGERGEIEAVFNSTGRPGRQTSTISVETDHPDQPDIRLAMQGMVTSPLRLSQSNIPLDIVPAGTEKSFSIYLLDTTGSDVEIVNFASTDDRLIVESGDPEPYTDEDSGRSGRRIPINVTVPADYPVSAVRANVQVQTDYSSRPNFPFMVHGRVAGEVALNPAQVYFGMVNPGTTEERVVMLQTADGSVFELEDHRIEMEGVPGGSLNSAPANVELSLGNPDPSRRGGQTLTVRVTAGDEPGRSGGRLVLKGKIGPEDNRRSVEVPLMVTGFVRNNQGARAGS